MSGDEVFVLIASIGVASVSWTVWLVRLQMRQRMHSGFEGAWLWAGPLLATVLTLLVLLFFSSQDVQTDPKYIFFYLMFAAAWVGLLRLVTPLYGISARDDALERRNVAAAAAWFGAVIGFTLCFAGGNIGDGPGWWVVLYAAGLATTVLLFLWVAYEWLTGISEVVTIERDTTGGLRLAGWLIASGVVLGAGVAGDWQSAGQTNVDFIQRAWPVLILLVAACLVERLAKSSPDQPQPNVAMFGIVPLTGYVLLACLWVTFIGLES
jgi:uncharacterized membrane protein YjfL (UPF0719 family)